jgi:hypothetical protein
MKSGDLEPSYIATLFNADGSVIDLTNATSVSLVVKATVGTFSFKAAAVFLNRAAGQVKYVWATGDTGTVGIHNHEFEIIWPTGRPQTVPNDSYVPFVVVQDLG